MTPPFEKSVFVNCPFDEEFAPILQAVCFCIVYLGFSPRLAPENLDNAAARLERIVEIIRTSKYGIHDLSRCKATSVGEFARMNMPFELGLDHACRRFAAGALAEKTVLVLEESRYDYQRALSDISGWDIQAYNGDYRRAMRRVRDWLVSKPSAGRAGTASIEGKYVAFQEWYWERELADGASEDDIREYPTVEIVRAMHAWTEEGQPV